MVNEIKINTKIKIEIKIKISRLNKRREFKR